MAKQQGATNGGDILQEYADSRGLTLPVDRAAGVIHGVKVLGMQSAKGREYPRAVLEKARPLYEGRPVNVDHVNPDQRRSYHDRIGCLKGVSLKEDGLYADLHYNPKHVLAEQLCWDAEHAPQNVGFSHDARGPSKIKGGRVVVESIDRVLSVDLVANPATTNGLFEDSFVEGQIADKIAADEERSDLCKLCCCAMDMVRSAMYDTENLTVEQAKAKIKSVMADWLNELTNPSPEVSGATPTQESTDMEWKDITVESLRTNRPDLLPVLQESIEQSEAARKAADDAAKQLTTLQEELSTLKTEKAARVLEETIDGELRAAKLDPSDKVAVSPAFLKTLHEAKDAADRKLLVEDRVAVLASSAAPRNVGPVTAGAATGGHALQEDVKTWAQRHRVAK